MRVLAVGGAGKRNAVSVFGSKEWITGGISGIERRVSAIGEQVVIRETVVADRALNKAC